MTFPDSSFTTYHSPLQQGRSTFCCTFPASVSMMHRRASWAKAVAVSHHCALWSPDFPPLACASDGRPTGPRKSHCTKFTLIMMDGTRSLENVRGETWRLFRFDWVNRFLN